MILEKTFTLMSNIVFQKTMENVRKQRFKLFITERRRNYLVSEPTYHTTKVFHRKFVGYRNDLVYLGLSTLKLGKILVYEFLVWLCKTKISRESKILLYGYRELHCIHKNRWYL